jgi:hypothetical protein
MNQYYDYCDAYDKYGTYENGRVLDCNNQIKTFSCGVCKQSKLVVKKSVNDPVFKCDECCVEAYSNDYSNDNNHKEEQQNQGNQEPQLPIWKWFSFF